MIADVQDGRARIVLLAGLGSQDARLGASVELVDAAIGAGLSAVAVDAGTARVTLDPGLSDLSAERADYGDVVRRIDDVLGEVKWGRLATIDRRSARPRLLIEALADIYHLVVVDTGALGKRLQPVAVCQQFRRCSVDQRQQRTARSCRRRPAAN